MDRARPTTARCSHHGLGEGPEVDTRGARVGQPTLALFYGQVLAPRARPSSRTPPTRCKSECIFQAAAAMVAMPRRKQAGWPERVAPSGLHLHRARPGTAPGLVDS